LCKRELENPQDLPKIPSTYKDELIMREEVVWGDEELDDVMSLDMADRVMGYQSSQGSSTPANGSSNM